MRETLWCEITCTGPIDISVQLHSKADLDLVACLLSCKPPADFDAETGKAFAKVVINGLFKLQKFYPMEARQPNP